MTAPTPPPLPRPPAWQPQTPQQQWAAPSMQPPPRRPLWARWWLWAALAVVTVLVVGVVAAAAQRHSTLSADDQQFCSDQATRLAGARQAVHDMVHGDRHWSSDGEPRADDAVDIEPAVNWLTSERPQNSLLNADLTITAEYLDFVGMSLLDGTTFDSDAAGPKRAEQALQNLQSFCDANG